MNTSTLIAILLVSIAFVQARDPDSMDMDATCRQECEGTSLTCYIPDPKDCSKFFECEEDPNNHEGWDAFHLECKEPLMFDTILNVCNWAEMVDCGERPIN